MDGYYTVSELARLLGVTRKAIRNREKRGTVKIYRPNGYLSLIDKEQGDRLIEKKKLEIEAKKKQQVEEAEGL